MDKPTKSPLKISETIVATETPQRKMWSTPRVLVSEAYESSKTVFSPADVHAVNSVDFGPTS